MYLKAIHESNVAETISGINLIKLCIMINALEEMIMQIKGEIICRDKVIIIK